MAKKTTDLESVVNTAIDSIKKLQTKIRKNRKDLVLLRFEQGMALKDIVGNAQYGDGEVRKIADAVEEFPTVLYRAYHLAKAFQFKKAGVETAIAQWEKEQRKLTYEKFEKEFVDTGNPDTYGGKDAATQHHLSQAEHAAHSLEEARRIGGATEELAGTAIMVVNAIDDFEKSRAGWNERSVMPDQDEQLIVVLSDSDGRYVKVGTVLEIEWPNVQLWMYEDVFLSVCDNVKAQPDTENSGTNELYL